MILVGEESGRLEEMLGRGSRTSTTGKWQVRSSGFLAILQPALTSDSRPDGGIVFSICSADGHERTCG